MKGIYVGIAVLCAVLILSWFLARVATHSPAVSAGRASEVGSWLTNYYKSPRPDQAPRMLELILPGLAKSMSPESYAPTVYAFARIAQLHPAALRGYESVFARADHQGRLIILKIFEQAGDAQTREFLTARLQSKPEHAEISNLLEAGFPHKIDAVERDIRTGADLDCLWAEFFLTGGSKPVLRVIDVLERPDRVRAGLLSWLESARREPERGAEVLEGLRKAAGIIADLEAGSIKTAGDLDCLSVLEKLEQSPRRFQAVRAALPFALSGEDLLGISIKVAAKWSLGSNAQQHPRVLEVSETEADKRAGRVRLALLEIAAWNRLAAGHYARAAQMVKSYLDLDPHHPDFQQELPRAEARLALLELAELPAKAAPEQSRVPGEPAQLAAQCAAATGKARSWCSRTIIRSRTPKDPRARTLVRGEWWVDFAEGERLHVLQLAWDETIRDYRIDEWVTIGSEHYENPGFWMKGNRDVRKEFNRKLRPEMLLGLLRSGAPLTAAARQGPRGTYVVLDYPVPAQGDWKGLFGDSGTPERAHVWIDSAGGLLSLAEVTARQESGGTEALEWLQAFAGYDAAIRVEAPLQAAPQARTR